MITTIKNQFIEVSVKSFGAELCSLKSTQTSKEYLWQGNKAIWGKHAPILFPIIGCMKGGQYTYRGQSYDMTKHGFARDMEFALYELGPDFLTYRLVSNADTQKVYPFEFELLVTYVLRGQELLVQYLVRNLSDDEMYFSIGGHPAFNCDMDKGGYYLEFDEEETLETRLVNVSNGLMKQETQMILDHETTLDLSYEVFDQDALVFENFKFKKIAIVNDDTGERLTIGIDGFPFLGIWSPPGPFVCIEPWYGTADYIDASGHLEQKVGIQRLEGKDAFECSYSIGI